MKYNSPNPVSLDDLVFTNNMGIIAPLWMNIGMGSFSTISYQVYDKSNAKSGEEARLKTMLQSVSDDVNINKKQTTFTARWALVVTWENVYPATARFPSREVRITVYMRKFLCF